MSRCRFARVETSGETIDSGPVGTFFPLARDRYGMLGGGGLDPRKLQQMMEQMGIEVEDIDATEVRIRTSEGDELVFDTPEVTQMDAQGQRTYQIVGEPERQEASDVGAEPAIPDDDVALVAEQAGVGQDEARDALVATDGDLAAAIDRLS